MTDAQWKLALQAARRLLGKGASVSWASDSWCAWTTFSSLGHMLTYWQAGLPDEAELQEHGTQDGGLWRQRFEYADLAHLIIPASFRWERSGKEQGYSCGEKQQDIQTLSRELEQLGIPHRLTSLVLEIKLY